MGRLLGAIAAAALAAWPAAAWAQSATNIIPAPLSAEPIAAVGPVTIDDGETIYAPHGDAEALFAARELAGLALKTRGLKLTVATGRPPRGGQAIVFVRRQHLGDEGYLLDIRDGRAEISATDGAGLLYGAVSLWQLMTPDDGRGPIRLDAVRIEDRPRFAWRGLMLDSARHFQTPAQVDQLIDWMALHKLNVLHWHLTDDQGWRLEIRKYPELTAVGAWRTPVAKSPDATPDGARYGGFYTQAQVREIVARAAQRHVTLVPEIEMPGHAVSALLAYPQFGAGAPPPGAAQAQWGGFPYVYSVDDKGVGFLEDVLTEVMALFPGRYIHVGGDEAAKERWNASPQAQARLRALGEADPAATQADFTRRIADFLEAHGRRLVGWDEILQGGDLPGDAVVMSWHGVDGALAAAAKGHDAVLAPAPMLYFDNRQADGPGEPPGRGVLVTLKDVYAFDPQPATLSPEAARHLLGLQGNLWTEHIRTWPQLQAMAFPRAAAVAEVAWSAPARRDWEGFLSRLPAQYARYEALGLGADHPAPAAPAGDRRTSQQMRLCNDKLTLNLEGPGGRTFLINPQDACWIYAGADLTGGASLTVAFARLPFMFGLDAGHNSVVIHPPRQPAGELEVRQDTCLSDPIAVAPLPPGPTGGQDQLTVPLPARPGRHDLCLTFTALTFDPLLAVDWAGLAPPAAARP